MAIATPGAWAHVYLRGRFLGETPGRFTLPPGRHILDIRPYGLAPGRRAPVTVRPGETARVTVSFEE